MDPEFIGKETTYKGELNGSIKDLLQTLKTLLSKEPK